MGDKGKRGDEKYWLIISLVLGLIVLGLALMFIFREYFSQEEVNWETCRQSVVLRGISPDTFFASTKSLSDLKCKTQVVNINYRDKIKAERAIAEAIAGCWYMVGSGDFAVFPGIQDASGTQLASSCIYCSRVHIDEKVKSFYNGSNEINILEALNFNVPGKKETYLQYLNPSEGKRAFNYYGGFSRQGFSLSSTEWVFGAPDVKLPSYNFPEVYDLNKGDLFVVYSEPRNNFFFKGDSKSRIIQPFIVFLQEKDLGELQKNWLLYFSIKVVPKYTGICGSIESVPA